MCRNAKAVYKRNVFKRLIVRLAFFILAPDCFECEARDECEYNAVMSRYEGQRKRKCKSKAKTNADSKENEKTEG